MTLAVVRAARSTAWPRRRCGSRCTWPMACRASRWSDWPTPKSRRRASACAPRWRTAGWASRPTSASPSTWRRPTCRRSPAASTCRSRSASWPPTARSTPPRWTRCEFAGELSLAGELRPVRGALALAIALAPRRQRRARWCCPRRSASEAALAPCRRRVQRPAPARRGGRLAAGRGRRAAAARRRARRSRADRRLPDLADVRGQAGGQARAGDRRRRRAQRADDRPARRRQVDAGAAPARPAAADDRGRGADQRRRRQPGRHLRHRAVDAAAAALAAPQRHRGGHRRRRLAAAAGRDLAGATAACCSSTSCPRCRAAALEALREPLETGRITISRAARQATFPARFQLVAAMNPCPCGWLGAAHAGGRACRCTPDQVARYQGRLSGPLIDRIDLQVEVPAVAADALMAGRDGEASATVAARVRVARERALQRQGCANGELTAAAHRRALRPRRRGARRCCSAPPSAWAGPAAVCTACSRSRARSPTWPAATPSSPRTSPRRCSGGVRCRPADARSDAARQPRGRRTARSLPLGPPPA